MALGVFFPIGLAAGSQGSTFAHCCEQINSDSARSARNDQGKHATSHKSAVPMDICAMYGVDVPGRAWKYLKNMDAHRLHMAMGSPGKWSQHQPDRRQEVFGQCSHAHRVTLRAGPAQGQGMDIPKPFKNPHSTPDTPRSLS